MKPKREIKFVVGQAEIELLMEADSHFFNEFFGKNRDGKRYEFTYSYEALGMLGHRIGATAFFTISRKRRRQFEKFLEKIHLLLRLSDSLSQMRGHVR